MPKTYQEYLDDGGALEGPVLWVQWLDDAARDLSKLLFFGTPLEFVKGYYSFEPIGPPNEHRIIMEFRDCLFFNYIKHTRLADETVEDLEAWLGDYQMKIRFVNPIMKGSRTKTFIVRFVKK